MKLNKGIIIALLFSLLCWICIYFIGFFQTTMFLIIIGAVIGIIIKLKENR